MSIITQQNINDYVNNPSAEQLLASGLSDAENTKWEKNIRGRNYDAEPGWGGFTFADNTLSNATPPSWMTGPQGSTTKGISNSTEYGPAGFSRLPNSTFGGQGSTYSSVLTSIAYMITGTPTANAWSGSNGAKMQTTFTSGSQMRSLKNAVDIPTGHPGAGMPVSSGGAFPAYVEGFAKEYRMLTGENDISEELWVDPTPIPMTGIRNISGMR